MHHDRRAPADLSEIVVRLGSAEVAYIGLTDPQALRFALLGAAFASAFGQAFEEALPGRASDGGAVGGVRLVRGGDHGARWAGRACRPVPGRVGGRRATSLPRFPTAAAKAPPSVRGAASLPARKWWWSLRRSSKLQVVQGLRMRWIERFQTAGIVRRQHFRGHLGGRRRQAGRAVAGRQRRRGDPAAGDGVRRQAASPAAKESRLRCGLRLFDLAAGAVVRAFPGGCGDGGIGTCVRHLGNWVPRVAVARGADFLAAMAAAGDTCTTMTAWWCVPGSWATASMHSCSARRRTCRSRSRRCSAARVWRDLACTWPAAACRFPYIDNATARRLRDYILFEVESSRLPWY